MDTEIAPFSLCGTTFNATPEAAGAFYCFERGRPEANDTGPCGMVTEIETFERMTRRLTHFVDVGALFGVFSLVFTGRSGTTAYAIEPSPWAFPILMEQCVANPDRRIRPLQALAGEVDGRMVDCGRDWKHVVVNSDRADAERVTLTERSIDSLSIPQVDCMKIDVEGYECAVLRGARETLAKWKPLLFLEAHIGDVIRNGDDAATLSQLLTDLGYRIYTFAGERTGFTDIGFTRVMCVAG